MKNDQVKSVNQFLAKMPDVDVNKTNFADYGYEFKFINSYQKKHGIVIQRLNPLKPDNIKVNSYYMLVYDAKGYKNNRSNCYFNVFNIIENIKTNKVILQVNNFPKMWRCSNKVQKCPGLHGYKVYLTKNLTEATKLCARLSYHEKEFLKEQESIMQSLSNLEQETLDLFDDISNDLDSMLKEYDNMNDWV